MRCNGELTSPLLSEVFELTPFKAETTDEKGKLLFLPSTTLS